MKKLPKTPDHYMENLLICQHLQILAKENKQLRFSQLLLMTGILSGTHFVANNKTAYEMDFYEEPLDLLNRITTRKKS